MKFNKDFTSVETANWKVELIDIGEGFSGDYNEDDPNDEPLFRFDFYSRQSAKHDWEVPNDSSYCTQLNANIDEEERKAILTYLLEAVQYEKWDTHIKKLCESLSWVSTDLAKQLVKESKQNKGKNK